MTVTSDNDDSGADYDDENIPNDNVSTQVVMVVDTSRTFNRGTKCDKKRTTTSTA